MVKEPMVCPVQMNGGDLGCPPIALPCPSNLHCAPQHLPLLPITVGITPRERLPCSVGA